MTRAWRARSGLLAAAVLVVLAGCDGMSTARGAGHPGIESASPSVATPTATQASAPAFRSGGTSEPAGTDAGVPPDPGDPPAAAAVTVAARFGAAWVRRTLPTARWWAGIAPLCEPGFAARLHTVDPANIPASRITGPARSFTRRSGLLAFTMPTDAGVLTVTVAALAGRWRVTGNDFRR